MTFVHSSWPPADSLVGLWAFASLDFPIDSTKVFAGIFNSPFRIYLYPSLTTSLQSYRDSIPYLFAVPPGTYKYVGVIQQVSAALVVKNFRVVGVVTDPVDTTRPRMIEVAANSQVTGVDIKVDFKHLPPQPFQ